MTVLSLESKKSLKMLCRNVTTPTFNFQQRLTWKSCQLKAAVCGLLLSLWTVWIYIHKGIDCRLSQWYAYALQDFNDWLMLCRFCLSQGNNFTISWLLWCCCAEEVHSFFLRLWWFACKVYIILDRLSWLCTLIIASFTCVIFLCTSHCLKSTPTINATLQSHLHCFRIHCGVQRQHYRNWLNVQ